MSTPPIGPGAPPPQPPSGGAPAAPASPAQSAQDTAILNSPFAKMFTQFGMTPTAKEVTMFINNILKDSIAQVKKSDAAWKASMDKMKRVMDGDD